MWHVSNKHDWWLIQMKLKINDSRSLFEVDKDYIIDVFSDAIRYTRNVAYSKYDNATWKKIVSDIRDIIDAKDGISIEDTIIENYNDTKPDDELFYLVSDILDYIEENNDSKYDKYADTVSILMRGEEFMW